MSTLPWGMQAFFEDGWIEMCGVSKSIQLATRVLPAVVVVQRPLSTFE